MSVCVKASTDFLDPIWMTCGGRTWLDKVGEAVGGEGACFEAEYMLGVMNRMAARLELFVATETVSLD